jgi:hypothetical protein
MKKLVTLLVTVGCLACFAQPTNVTLYVNTDGKDCEVNSTSAGTNHNATGRLQVLYTLSTGQILRSFIHVDLSSIPSNAIIVSAALNVYAAGVTNTVSHPLYIRRVSATWSETTITWTNQPATISSDQLSITHAATSSTGWHTFNVKTHVQNMVNYPALNFGWRISLQNEAPGGNSGVTYRDSEQTTQTTQRPYLDVSYVLPIGITATVDHCSENHDDGVISGVTVTEGTETYSSYEWFKYVNGTVTSIESGSNIADAGLSGLADGLYMLRVTDNGSNVGYKYFLVGEENAVTTVQFSNSNNTNAAAFNDDALIGFTIATSDGTVNGGTATYIQAQKDASVYIYALLKYQAHFDPLLSYENADLCLYSALHYRESGNSNAGKVKRVTSDWQENVVTWNTMPTTTTTGEQSIPQTSTTGYVDRDDTIDMLGFIQYWSANPTQNYGVRFDINTAQSGFLRLLYYSYDYTTHADRPKLILTYSLQSVYHELTESPEGSYYAVPADDILRVKYLEEYLDEDWSLTYKIKDQAGVVQIDEGDQAKVIEHGDNRLRFDVSALSAGFYTLEVVNEKNEKWYLRFEVI